MIVLAMLALAAPARAAEGNGLYEPFPSGEQGEQADSYYGQLGLRVGPRELEKGVVTTALRSTSSAHDPSRRAGIGIADPEPVLLLLVLAGALAVAFVVRRSTHHTAP